MTPQIQNANTTTGIVSSGIAANSVLPPIVRCAPLPQIGTRIRLRKNQIQTGVQRVPHVISNTAAQSNAANFQSGDTVIEELEIDVLHVSKSAGLTSQELNVGLVPAHVSDALERLVEADVWALWIAKLTGAVFGVPDVSALVADIDEADVEDLIAAELSTPRCLMLQPAARENIAPLLKLGNSGFEYPGVKHIHEIGADFGDGHTVLCGPEAFAYAVEQPPFISAPPGEVLIQEITLPRLGVPAWRYTWYDRGARSAWQSVELFFGVTPANVAALAYAADPEE